ncbi:hypothetical protein I6N90_13475 [Paenibacillus sp. GSMTC-2017]|uniref:sensor histidine kinase n=1 Tax=Paenibacillus sp. GSMTC-2017 TaxID=2794350 RepID=UPI0018D65204|nr:ATP-binding protein [Paenibacillus sp. GSMTC-2017]MBH5318812.1 hypothetical protein [Paenibacillus sp. GSMTC-2017]
MKKHWNKSLFTIQVVSINSIFLILLVYICMNVHSHPFMGIYAELHNGKWQVTKVDKECGASKYYDIEEGDIVLKVDGVSPDENYNIKKWNTVEGFSSASFVKSNGQIIGITVDDKLSKDCINSTMPYTILALIIWSVGIYALYKRPPSKALQSFFLLNQVSAIVAITAYPASSGLLFAKVANIISAAWIPYLLIVLFIRFPVKTQTPFIYIVKLINLFSGILFTLALTLYLITGLSSEIMIVLFRYGLSISIGISYIVGIGIAIRNMVRISLAENRLMSTLLLVGTSAVLLIPLIFSILPEVVTGDVIVVLEVSIFANLCLPAIFLYALVKRREFNIQGHVQQLMQDYAQSNLSQNRLQPTSREYTDPVIVSQMLIHAQEAEKQRLAAHLHDHHLQNLIFIMRDFERLSMNDPSRMDSNSSSSLLESMKDAIYDVREICAELYPSMIEDLGLRSSLQWLIRETKNRHNISIDWEYIDVQEERLHYTVKVSLFRIMKELVANTLKHAKASHLFISLVSKSNMLICEIKDNGMGFDPSRDQSGNVSGKHFGLIMVQKRIHNLGGKMKMISDVGEGTKVTLSIPIVEGSQ